MYKSSYKQYGMKKGYKIRKKNDLYYDGTSFESGIVYQPDVYRLVNYLAERSGAEYIIDIGAGNGEKIAQYIGKNYKIIAIDCAINLKELRENLPDDSKIIEYDLEKGLPSISDDILSKSIVVSSDVIEHIVDLKKYLHGISRISHIAPFVVISTPDRDRVRGIGDYGPPVNQAHVREWTASELHWLLKEYKFNNLRTGYTINTNIHKEKSTIISIAGNHNLSDEFTVNQPKKTVQAIITTFNVADIIEHVAEHALDQGLDLYFVDNWSNDGTHDILKLLQDKYKERIKIERYPAKNRSKDYEWTKLLDRVDSIASKSSYDWIVHYDSDELRYSPNTKVSIQDAISFVDKLGYNAIDHTVLDFRPVDDSYTGDKSPTEAFNYYEYGKRPGHFIQLKAWKNPKRLVGLSVSGGHDIQIDDKKVYPLKFLIKHYPLRTQEQARRKIFKERIPRISKTDKAKGWHDQYNKFNKNSSFLWDSQCLLKYHSVMSHQENIVELLSGIGILDQ